MVIVIELKRTKTISFYSRQFRQAGIPVQGQPKLDQPVFGDPPPYIEGAKLLALDAFFSGPRRIGTPVITAEKGYVSEQLKKAIATRNANVRIMSMSFSGLQNPGYFGLREWVNTPATGVANVFFVVSDEPQTIPNSPVYAMVTYSVRSEEGPFALDWLRQEAFGRSLVDQKTGVVFPHLKAFWDRISSMNQNEATVFLQNELSSSSRGTLSFFGIPVERSLALWAGPAVCLSVLIFLAIHLRHTRHQKVSHEVFKTYPWVPLFRGFLPLVATYSSILFLPTLANLTLLGRYAVWQERSSKTALALILLMIGASIWALIEIHLLRRITYPKWE